MSQAWRVLRALDIRNDGTILAEVTWDDPSPTSAGVPSGNVVGHVALLAPELEFRLRHPTDDIAKGWDYTGYNRWRVTSVGTGKTNNIIKVNIPAALDPNKFVVEVPPDSQDLIEIISSTVVAPNRNSHPAVDGSILFEIRGKKATELSAGKPGAIVNLRAKDKPGTIQLIHVRVFDERPIKVDIFFVTNASFSATVISSHPTADAIVAHLNTVYNPQANITFSLGQTSDVHVGTGSASAPAAERVFESSGRLKVPDPIGHDWTNSSDTMSAAIAKVIAQAQLDHPRQTNTIRIFAVNSILYVSGADSFTNKNGQNDRNFYCVVKAASGLSVYAHEVGHSLGLSHQTRNFPEEVAVGLMYPNVDGDAQLWLNQDDWVLANKTADAKYK